MLEVLDCTMPCLCCDEVVLLSSETVNKMKEPVAFCPDCHRIWVHPQARAIVPFMFLVRSQLAEATRNIARLFTAYEQIEEAIVTEPAT